MSSVNFSNLDEFFEAYIAKQTEDFSKEMQAKVAADRKLVEEFYLSCESINAFTSKRKIDRPAFHRLLDKYGLPHQLYDAKDIETVKKKSRRKGGNTSNTALSSMLCENPNCFGCSLLRSKIARNAQGAA